jgi:hypothetical protein
MHFSWACPSGADHPGSGATWNRLLAAGEVVVPLGGGERAACPSTWAVIRTRAGSSIVTEVAAASRNRCGLTARPNAARVRALTRCRSCGSLKSPPSADSHKAAPA